ncbi:hypothetical protein HNO88_002430 [Novosphingobium chloroacetimidivorans]|uniref:Uncharacterized protein n=1 Tax=Novosphingobium chloroacetimidivorans TaxID=1428314 RepID=A0A7W7KBB0_9SPHN|nr:hypothetical protein [Novosphingobium chloroacetimidivorans]MBB4859104.1 hypothetical protein [Novosphingobium chloroacetimidivorans]
MSARMTRQAVLWAFGLLQVPTLCAPALARPQVATQSTVYVERVQPDRTRRLEPADRFIRGDRVITVVNWSRRAGNRGFVITNPLPAALAYQGSAWDDQDVSVDGGRTWGRLGALRVGGRSATAEDVTHVRWRIPPRVQARGQIAYSGIVR